MKKFVHQVGLFTKTSIHVVYQQYKMLVC